MVGEPTYLKICPKCHYCINRAIDIKRCYYCLNPRGCVIGPCICILNMRKWVLQIPPFTRVKV